MRASIHFSFAPQTFTILSVFLVGTLYSCAPAPSAAGASPKPEAKSAEKPAGDRATTQATGLYQPDSGSPKLPSAEKFTFNHPDHVRGIYLTAWSAASPRKMEKILGMLDRTDLNAVVIDIRDNGEMYFKTGIPMAKVSPPDQIAISDPTKLFERLKKHNVWPIARIACFRDRYLPLKRPDLAVQGPNGKPWHDRSGHYWLDPYAKENWDYLVKTVEYAMDAGFPEIQLDYVRFPSEGKSSTQVFPNKAKYGDPKAKPWDVVGAFAKYVGDQVHARGRVYSADIFGIISESKKDQGIGQDLETIAQPFDVLSPMIYPSHFAKGEYGIADPNRSPYEIIKKTLADYKRRVPKKAIRPWLQDFSLFGVHYGPDQVRAQIKAARELGYEDYLMWNAGNRYTESAYLPSKSKSGPKVANKTP